MVNNFVVDQIRLYINWANTSLFIIFGILPTLNLPIKNHPFLRYFRNFSVKLSWLQKRGNKLNTTLYDRYYLQNCKAMIFIFSD